jgi:hypothetical protein
MSKYIPQNVLDRLFEQTATEPAIMIAINWGLGFQYYISREMGLSPFYRPIITDISSITYSKRDDSLGSCGSMSVTLSDTDGRLKSLMDGNSIEKKEAIVYLCYANDPVDDRMILLKGEIVGPVEWKEGSRELSFGIESIVEDYPLGYAPTKEDFPDLADEVEGVPWPMIFGKVAHSPCIQVRKRTVGQLMFDARFYLENSHEIKESKFIVLKGNPDVFSYSSEDMEKGYLYINGGDRFPSGIIKIQIDGVIFQGEFVDNVKFKVHKSNVPKYENIRVGPRVDGDPDLTNRSVLWLESDEINLSGHHCYFKNDKGRDWYNYCIRQEGKKCWFRYKFYDPSGTSPLYEKMGTNRIIKEVYSISKNGMVKDLKGMHDWLEKTRFDIPGKRFGFAIDVLDRFRDRADSWWSGDSDTDVTLATDDPDIYIASLVNLAEITAVYGKRELTDRQGRTRHIFVPIPKSYYEIQLTSNYQIAGEYASGLVFPKPLSYFEGGWSDEVYVTAESTVGPNTADIIEYILFNFTRFDIDRASFAAVSAKVGSRPANFTLFDQRNALEVAKEIAWQSMCVLITEGDKIRIKYLAEQPDVTLTLTISNTLKDSFQSYFTESKDLITRLVGTYTPSYKDKFRLNRIKSSPTSSLQNIVNAMVPNNRRSKTATEYYVYENNVDIYGLRAEEKNIYIYNEREYVEDVINFWGRRFSKCWRMVRATTFLQGAALEPFDGVTVSYPGGVFPAVVVAVAESITVNPVTGLTNLVLWTPIPAGKSSADSGAWLPNERDRSLDADV